MITDKSQPHTPRPEVIQRLALQILEAQDEDPSLNLILGHGSGSFGHAAAERYDTRKGVRTVEEWRGFFEVWQEARTLNQIVMAILQEVGLPAIVFPPSATITAADAQVAAWNLTPITLALQSGQLPVVYGDVVFDKQRGGTVLSTEDLFAHLARKLNPERILLAGFEPGVWADYPAKTRIVPEITPENWEEIGASLGGSAGFDVTGGMVSKVKQSMALVEEIDGLEVVIFSGEEIEAIRRTLRGERLGTVIRG